MSAKRGSLGFGDELDDLSEVGPSKVDRSDRPDSKLIGQAAEAAGFRSREPTPLASDVSTRQLRRRRTGRNAQFNLKTKPETIAAFMAIADAKGWGLGETFERATELLEREYGTR